MLTPLKPRLLDFLNTKTGDELWAQGNCCLVLNGETKIKRINGEIIMDLLGIITFSKPAKPGLDEFLEKANDYLVTEYIVIDNIAYIIVESRAVSKYFQSVIDKLLYKRWNFEIDNAINYEPDDYMAEFLSDDIIGTDTRFIDVTVKKTRIVVYDYDDDSLLDLLNYIRSEGSQQ